MLRSSCKEVTALTRLSNAHIVQLLGVQVDMHEEKVYMVMELCQGGELFDRIAECGGLAEDEARRYFAQVLHALAHCHENRVYHRDLKPENILLDANDNAKVADFGLAAVYRHVAGDQGGYLQHTKVGSVMYAAPEVLTSTAAMGYDAACADMWSLGVILFSMLSGTLPFTCAAASKCRRYAAVLTHGIGVMCPEHLSAEVTHLLGRLLHPEPAQRITPQEALQSDWLRGGQPTWPKHYIARNRPTDELGACSWTITMRVPADQLSQLPSAASAASAAAGAAGRAVGAGAAGAAGAAVASTGSGSGDGGDGGGGGGGSGGRSSSSSSAASGGALQCSCACGGGASSTTTSSGHDAALEPTAHRASAVTQRPAAAAAPVAASSAASSSAAASVEGTSSSEMLSSSSGGVGPKRKRSDEGEEEVSNEHGSSQRSSEGGALSSNESRAPDGTAAHAAADTGSGGGSSSSRTASGDPALNAILSGDALRDLQAMPPPSAPPSSAGGAATAGAGPRPSVANAAASEVSPMDVAPVGVAAGEGSSRGGAGGVLSGLPLRGCVSEYVQRFGWGALPRGTEHLLRDILTNLRSMGLRFTLAEHHDPSDEASVCRHPPDVEPMRTQRLSLTIQF